MKKDFTYTSRVRYRLVDGIRHADLPEADGPLVYGTPGPLREYYDSPAEKPHGPSTLDHLVATAGACMYETLKSALTARRVEFDPQTFTAEAAGRFEDERGVLHLRDIVVRYRLRVPAAQRAKAERALAVHPRGCPVHRSIGDAVPIRWEAEVEEIAPRPAGETAETST